MNWNEHLLLWNEATVKLLDIRYQSLVQGDELRGYKLPSNAFLWVTYGRGRVMLDGVGYAVDGFHLLHGGKGMSLDMSSSGDRLEYALIMYKALLAVPGNRYLDRLLKRSSPFHIQYGFTPHTPLSLHSKFEIMEQSWRKLTLLDKLYAKGVFYQFVYELVGQMAGQELGEIRVDLVSRATRYIETSYSEAITVEGLAEQLGCSSSYLSRLFKKQLGTTPNEYLIRVRVEHASRLLTETKASLQQISLSIGYLDVYYFSRMFKKQTGVSPLRFRSWAAEVSVQKSPFNRSGQAIVPRKGHGYNDNDSHYEKEGDLTMYKDLKLSVGAVMLLCMTLLFSGCGASTGANEPSVTAGSPATVTQEQQQTKKVKHMMGESEVPINPQRIAVNGLEDIMLAIDAPMVHAQSMKGQYLYDTLQAKKVPSVYTPGGLNYESILDSKPDLIIANLLPSDTESYEQLSKIAPTIVYDRSDWQTSIAAIGKAIGLEDKAQSVIQDYEEKLGKAKEAIVAKIGADRTLAFIRPTKQDVQLFFPAFSYTSIAYEDLGLILEPMLAGLKNKEEEGTWGVEASLEKLPELTADYLFVTVGGSFDSEDEAQAALQELNVVEELNVWKSIPAVQQGNVYKMSSRHWMLNGPTADSMKIDDVLAAFDLQ
ncbi:AraC family transcriptional regulator [Paenibacillus paeoniae]|uniref:Helix-turn-helix domain-containing protein n=1 Tax=Paenibacillus paeoniae TaxID=2292705 RepID=A0A371PI56_9BACL|nr:helix-turn-helix domain-containing protein [Paenibacillus paeoniae]REK75585.1 helix-turn-helix domain-containing protein [Paenibacillus paeoniae]